MRELFETIRGVAGLVGLILAGYGFMWIIAQWGKWYYGF